MVDLIDPQSLSFEQQAIAAESIGWLPMGEGAYLHVGTPEAGDAVILIVGCPDVSLDGVHALLLT